MRLTLIIQTYFEVLGFNILFIKQMYLLVFLDSVRQVGCFNQGFGKVPRFVGCLRFLCVRNLRPVVVESVLNLLTLVSAFVLVLSDGELRLVWWLGHEAGLVRLVFEEALGGRVLSFVGGNGLGVDHGARSGRAELVAARSERAEN